MKDKLVSDGKKLETIPKILVLHYNQAVMNLIVPSEKENDTKTLHRMFNILKTGHRTLDEKYLLIMSIKGINDTMGPDGPATSLLIFGFLPFFFLNHKLPEPIRATGNYMYKFSANEKNIFAEKGVPRSLN